MSLISEKNLKISSREYAALMDILGLAHEVHMMLMTAKRMESGEWKLTGEQDIFQELLDVIVETVEAGLTSKSQTKHFINIHQRLSSYENPFQLKELF